MKTKVVYLAAIALSWMFLSMTGSADQQKEPWNAPSKYEKMKNPYAGADDSESIGRTLYAKHCKSCHGTKGKGDGSKAASIDTPIGDFTDGSIKGQSEVTLTIASAFRF